MEDWEKLYGVPIAGFETFVVEVYGMERPEMVLVIALITGKWLVSPVDMEKPMLAVVRSKTKLFVPKSWSTAFGSKGENFVIPMQLRGMILISKEIYARGEIRC